MTTNITRWSPDTCGCVLEYAWDSTSTEDDRVHTPHSVVKACPAHTGMTVKKVHEAVGAENRSKNNALEAIKTHAPTLTVLGTVDQPIMTHDKTDLSRLVATIDTEEVPAIVFHPEIGVSWEYAGKGTRSLVVKLEGANVTADEKARIDQALADMEVPTAVHVLVI